MKILFATDHAGFKLKEKLIPFVESLGYEVEDYGAYEYDENDDYPDAISKVASDVSDNPEDTKGIILGGSGQGEAITANRFPNVRAIVFNGQCQRKDGVEVPNEIIISREHNDANILSLGARFLSEESAKEAVKMWLETEFLGDKRHKRRIAKIDEITKMILEKDDFDKWNGVKKELNEKIVKLYYHPREIWWCYLGLNIGTEQDGNNKKFLRPVVVARAFGPNTCLIVPLTTSTKKHHLRISIGKVKEKEAVAILSQIKVIDTKRLLEKFDFVEKEAFEKLRKAVKNLF